LGSAGTINSNNRLALAGHLNSAYICRLKFSATLSKQMKLARPSLCSFR